VTRINKAETVSLITKGYSPIPHY